MEHFPSTLSRAESDALFSRIQAHIERHRFGLWAVEVRGGPAWIGFCGLSVPSFNAPFTPCVEVGWRLAAAHWGNGYATEAAAAVRDLAFTTWDRPYVISLIRPVNVSSQAVARRIGMTPTRPVEFHGYEHVVWRVERTSLPDGNPASGRG